MFDREVPACSGGSASICISETRVLPVLCSDIQLCRTTNNLSCLCLKEALGCRSLPSEHSSPTAPRAVHMGALWRCSSILCSMSHWRENDDREPQLSFSAETFIPAPSSGPLSSTQRRLRGLQPLQSAAAADGTTADVAGADGTTADGASSHHSRLWLT